MASNFKIFSHRNRDSLHLQMYGDFDGNSAYEVISALEKHGTEHIQVFIDTNDLRNIHAFGINVFQKHINALEKKSNHLVFLGKILRRKNLLGHCIRDQKLPPCKNSFIIHLYYSF